MSRRIPIWLVVGAICASGARAETWNSELFPKIGGKFTVQTVQFAEREWTLDDFSYAGYRLGAESLGNIPCRKVVQITGQGDISEELQGAIDAAGAAGGGIVIIPKGVYTMSSAVSIPYDNVSIAGESSADTLIRIPSDYQSHEGSNMAEGVFTFGRKLNASNRGWVDKGPVVATVSSPIPRGSLAVETGDASRVDIGSWVVVQQYFWKSLVDNNSHQPDQWPADSTFDHSIFSFSYLRRVVDKSGNRIFLDAPIPTALDPANNPVHIRLTDGRMRENSGIARLTIEFDTNTDARTGRPHGTAVYFEGMRDGWVYDVHVSDFPRNGFYADFSARITFLDCSVNGAQDKGGDGYGYGFLEGASQSILYRRLPRRRHPPQLHFEPLADQHDRLQPLRLCQRHRARRYSLRLRAGDPMGPSHPVERGEPDGIQPRR